MKIPGWGDMRASHCSCWGTKHGMNSAFIRHQRLHPAAQSEGTQIWFPCLCCSPNPLFTLWLTHVCARVHRAAQIFNTINLSHSNSWNEAASLWCLPTSECTLQTSRLPQTGRRPMSLELICSCPTAVVEARGKEGTFFLSLTEHICLSSSSPLSH